MWGNRAWSRGHRALEDRVHEPWLLLLQSAWRCQPCPEARGAPARSPLGGRGG